MILNLTDANGNSIGTVEVADGLTTDQQNAIIAQYQFVPPAPTATQVVSSAVQEAIDFGRGLVVQCATENVLMGITQANQTKAVQDYLSNLIGYLKAGALYAAIQEMANLNTAGIPSDLSPFVTLDRLNTYLNYIQTYLQITLTTMTSGGSS